MNISHLIGWTLIVAALGLIAILLLVLRPRDFPRSPTFGGLGRQRDDHQPDNDPDPAA